jgi:hypothetical protein
VYPGATPSIVPGRDLPTGTSAGNDEIGATGRRPRPRPAPASRYSERDRARLRSAGFRRSGKTISRYHSDWRISFRPSPLVQEPVAAGLAGSTTVKRRRRKRTSPRPSCKWTHDRLAVASPIRTPNAPGMPNRRRPFGTMAGGESGEPAGQFSIPRRFCSRSALGNGSRRGFPQRLGQEASVNPRGRPAVLTPRKTHTSFASPDVLFYHVLGSRGHSEP